MSVTPSTPGSCCRCCSAQTEITRRSSCRWLWQCLFQRCTLPCLTGAGTHTEYQCVSGYGADLDPVDLPDPAEPIEMRSFAIGSMPGTAAEVAENSSSFSDEDRPTTNLEVSVQNEPTLLLQEMDSKKASEDSCTSEELECLVCMEEFCKDNPEILTLCKCGINRGHWHLMCLMQWLEKEPHCPVCREAIYFEEMM